MKKIILCPFDNGIRVMQQFNRGVYGAAKAPKVMFSLLCPGKIPEHVIPIEKYNTGINEDTYRAHDEITKYIENIEGPFLVLGGDHSITYPIIKGLVKNLPKKKLGLIYFDAHYDLRELEDGKVLSSGNSFYQILTDPEMPIKGSNMVAIGIQPNESPSYLKLEEFGKKHKMTTIYRKDVNEDNAEKVMEYGLKVASEGTDGVYLSFDIDALRSVDAPGASAPGASGLHLEWVKRMLRMGKFIAADITEVSCREKSWDKSEDAEGYDKLMKTAQSAAELVNAIEFTKI